MSLAWQIVLLLGIALLPIGGLAVFEAVRANERAASLASSQLMTIAQAAAELERLEIAEGFGVVKTLARSSAITSGDRAACEAELVSFIASSRRYIFAGYTDQTGRMECSSVAGTVRDFSEDEGYLEQLERPSRTVRVVESGNVTSRAVLIVSHPVYVDGTWRGTLSLSVPREVVGVFSEGSRDLNVALVDDQGQVLARGADEDDSTWWLPVGLQAASEWNGTASIFRGTDSFGVTRTYARVPIVGGEIAGIFAHQDEIAANTALWPVLRAILLPGLVWVLCIALAFVAMRRLVVNGIRRIQRAVVAFRRGDRELALVPIPGASGELEELSRSFSEMARAVDAGEQELSGLVEEKTVLLLEVYHRVKNNLQLIISIMNIQLRGAQDERERMAIRTLRERVMGLALVHQRLYETPNLTSVPADRIVREIVSNLSETNAGETGATILSDLASIELHPDQAVPFSLLFTEAMMNALNYSGQRGEDWRISIGLDLEDGDTVSLRLANTMPDETDFTPREPRSGMGEPLMRAFVMQLAGEMTKEITEEEYILLIRFRRSDLHEEGGQRIGMPGREKAAMAAGRITEPAA